MKDELLELIDSYEDIAIELETELCKIPAISPDSGGTGEIVKCKFLQSWLKAKGFGKLDRYDAPDERANKNVRPNLIATIDGTDQKKPSFWVMSHLDVVPPGEFSLWKSDPYKAYVITGNDGKKRIIGRGVEDNQQGLISSVLAALAINQLKITPPRPVKLLFVSDEENGSLYGVDWLINNHPDLFTSADSALVPDSGEESGCAIEVAEKNIVWVRFVTKGIQVHGSRPDLGKNAHLAGAELALRLHEGLTKKFADKDPLFDLEYSSFEPTKKEANVPNINTIPGEDVFCMDMRLLPRYQIKTVFAEIDRIIGEVEAKYGVTIEYTTPQSIESKPTSPDAPLVKALMESIEDIYSVKPKPVGIGGGTVAAYLRNIGIDAAVWCRIHHTAHQPNEYAVLENILGDAKVMALMMLKD